MAAQRYTCARCGARLKPDEYVYSRWTKSRYCSSLTACDKRAKRRKAAAR